MDLEREAQKEDTTERRRSRRGNEALEGQAHRIRAARFTTCSTISTTSPKWPESSTSASGSDYDGVSVLPTQLDDVSCYPYITQGLLDRGYTEEQIQGILGGNLMRVFRGAEAACGQDIGNDIAAEQEKAAAVARSRSIRPIPRVADRSGDASLRDVERIVKKLADASGGRLTVEKFAESVEGRPIYLATLGTGPRRVLLWSQMHGDEPTHTAVMLDLFSYLLQQPAKPLAADILAGCTLMFIPMLNPDGAEAVIRFNAQGIDINRDWRRQATPEGRALLRAAKTLKPQFGFNLHNQNARTSVGRPPRPAAVSVLAPPPDASRKESPSMRSAKQMCTCFVEAVRPYAEGMISRYDDTYEPRAFGDGDPIAGRRHDARRSGRLARGRPRADDAAPLSRHARHASRDRDRQISRGRRSDLRRPARVELAAVERLPDHKSQRARRQSRSSRSWPTS